MINNSHETTVLKTNNMQIITACQNQLVDYLLH